MQEGKIGLINAIQNFDLDRGTRLSTYAYSKIRQAINRFIDNNAKTIRVPVYAEEKLAHYDRLTSDENALELDHEDLSRALDVTKSVTKILEHASNQKINSIDKPIASSNSGDKYLKDIVADPVANLDTLVGQKMDAVHINSLIKQLVNEKEFDILSLRMGLDDRGKHSMQEIGDIYGVSKQRIDQIEKKARKKLLNNKELQSLSLEILEN